MIGLFCINLWIYISISCDLINCYLCRIQENEIINVFIKESKMVNNSKLQMMYLMNTTPAYAFFSLKSLVVSNNNWTLLSVQTRYMFSVLIFFFRGIFDSTTLYFCSPHIQFNIFHS